MGRRGLHLDGIIYTDCPLKLALSTGIYNTSKRTSQIKGSCLYWCVLFLHWDMCASSPRSCVHALCRQTHMDVFKHLHACMNMHLYRGWMYTCFVCVCVRREPKVPAPWWQQAVSVSAATVCLRVAVTRYKRCGRSVFLLGFPSKCLKKLIFSMATLERL